MTPKEKAETLVEVYYTNIISFLSDNMKWENAKKGSLIAVDEIIHTIIESKTEYWDNYWEEVKQEIEKL